MKFRKKPVVIDAWPIAHDTASHYPPWVLEAMNKGQFAFDPWGKGVVIRTREGEMRGDVGDMLIKGIAGELYPCAKRIFDATYESVPE